MVQNTLEINRREREREFKKCPLRKRERGTQGSVLGDTIQHQNMHLFKKRERERGREGETSR